MTAPLPLFTWEATTTMSSTVVVRLADWLGLPTVNGASAVTPESASRGNAHLFLLYRVYASMHTVVSPIRKVKRFSTPIAIFIIEHDINYMCLAIPGKVLKVEDGCAQVDFRGDVRKVHTELVVPKEGEWVLAYANQIMEVLPDKKAKEILESMEGV